MVDLRDNKVERLPQNFGNLRKLLKLNLDQNCLRVIQATFGNLRTLSDLSLAKNQISLIEEDCLCWLNSLVLLDLHENKLTAFGAVPSSAKLDTLVLSFNQLRGVEGLQHAPNLTVIDLHNNKLAVLPETILQLYKLKTLQISNNDMNGLDPRLSLLPELTRISIEGNPLRSIKPAMRSANAV